MASIASVSSGAIAVVRKSSSTSETGAGLATALAIRAVCLRIIAVSALLRAVSSSRPNFVINSVYSVFVRDLTIRTVSLCIIAVSALLRAVSSSRRNFVINSVYSVFVRRCIIAASALLRAVFSSRLNFVINSVYSVFVIARAARNV
jgi:hypothetical protein